MTTNQQDKSSGQTKTDIAEAGPNHPEKKSKGQTKADIASNKPNIET